MSSPSSDSSLTIDENSSSSSEKGLETNVGGLIDAESPSFNPLVALYCENKALNLTSGSKYLHVYELEKAIPDPTQEPIKKSSIEIAASNARARLLAKKPPPALLSLAQASASGKSFKKTFDNEQPGSSQGTRQNPVASSGGPQATAPTSASVSTSASKGKEQPDSEPFYPMPGRKFLPHQMPVYRPPKKHPNVMTAMEDVSGPLAALREAKKSNKQVKIWTRGLTGIRGYCVAYVQAFDCHWNLALFNVSEVFQRKRAIRTEELQANKIKSSQGHQDQDQDQHERREFKSGKYLRDLSKSRSKRQSMKAEENVNSNDSRRHATQTCQDMMLKGTMPILIQGPDALLTCRLHFNELTVGDHLSNSRTRVQSKSITQKPSSYKPQLKVSSSSTSQSRTTTKPTSASLASSDDSPATKSQLRKKRLTIFQEPLKDPFGFLVVARSKHYEIVERYQKHLFLVGNEVAFIELNPASP